MQTIKNSRFSQRPSLRKIAITVCAAALPALGWAAPFAYQPEGDAALGGAKLGILDIATGQSTTQPLTDDFTSPSYISVNRAGTRVYLGGPFKSVVGIFDTRENSFSTVDIPNRGLIGIVSHPDSSRFYVGTSIGVLYEVNALSKSVRAFPVAGSLNGVAISKDGAYVYAASAIDGAVYAVNTTDGSVSRYLLGASPSGSIAVSPDGLHFYVALGDEPKLAVVSTATKNISTVPIGRGRAYTEGVAVSPVGDRVAVVNTTDGTLSIIDMSNRAAPSVTTEIGRAHV